MTALRTAGATYAEIGQRFGVTRQAAHKALHYQPSPHGRGVHRLTPDERHERFLSRLTYTADGCWEYRTERLCSKRHTLCGELAYRYAYKHFVGPVPKGMVLDHLCGNERCANPDHLDPCTRGENARRGSGPHFHLRGR
jgi:hypothetical protein